jgi:hypothetical protein
MTDYKDEIRSRAGFNQNDLRPEYVLQPGEYTIGDLSTTDPEGFLEGESLIELQRFGDRPEKGDKVEYRRVEVDTYRKEPTGFVDTLSKLAGKDPAAVEKLVNNRDLPEADLRALTGEVYSPSDKQVDYLAFEIKAHLSTTNTALEKWEDTGRYYPIWIDSVTGRIIDGNHRAAAFVALQPGFDPLTWVSEL